MILEISYATLRNNGVLTNSYYVIDEAHYAVNETALANIYRSDPKLMDAELLAR